MADTNLISSEINTGIPSTIPDNFKHPEVRAAVEMFMQAVYVLHQSLEQHVGITQKKRDLWDLISPDDTILRHYQGRLYVTAGENLSFGHFVNLYKDAGILKARKADSTNGRPANGYCNVSGGTLAGARTEVILSFGVMPLTGVTPGDIVYLGTAGQGSLAPNTTVGKINQVLGFGVDTNLMYVYIQDNVSGATGTPTTYTDEMAQDAIGAIWADTDTVDFTYDDALNLMQAVVKYQMSITKDVNGLKLSGDSAAPGNRFAYGTDGAGAKGWYQWALSYLSDVDFSTPPTNGQALVYDNALTKWKPGNVAAGGGGGGGLVLLEQKMASSSASLDFTGCISSDYDDYLIEIVSLIPATNDVTFHLRFSTDGGATFDSGSNYTGGAFRASRAGWAYADVGGTSINLSGGPGTHVNTSTKPFLSSFRILNPQSTSLHKRVLGQTSAYDGTANPDVTTHWTATYQSVSVVNAFRIFASSGNLASGTIRVYGFRKI